MPMMLGFGILILGRFSCERQAVLDAISRKLRVLDLCPIVFDSEKPKNLDIIETIVTLAGMSKYTIADIPHPRVIIDELRSIVPDLLIPVIPLFHPTVEALKPYASLRTRQKYHWFIEPVIYEPKEQLIKMLPEKIIQPAELKRLELLEIKQ